MANRTIAALTTSDALTGTELFYADGLASSVPADVKVTADQIKQYANPGLLVRKTGIANATATAVITVTVPNALVNAAIFLDIMAHLGAGDDASESTRCATGSVVLARVTDVATVAAVSTLEAAQIATVSGGGTLTLAYDLSSVSGAAVGGIQTFTIRLTLTVTGSIDNHTAVVSARLLNSNLLNPVTLAAA